MGGSGWDRSGCKAHETWVFSNTETDNICRSVDMCRARLPGERRAFHSLKFDRLSPNGSLRTLKFAFGSLCKAFRAESLLPTGRGAALCRSPPPARRVRQAKDSLLYDDCAGLCRAQIDCARIVPGWAWKAVWQASQVIDL